MATAPVTAQAPEPVATIGEWAAFGAALGGIAALVSWRADEIERFASIGAAVGGMLGLLIVLLPRLHLP